MGTRQGWSRIVAATAVAAAAGVHAGPGTWTSTGPDGGQVMDLVADPLGSETLVAATRGGLFRSTDGGDHWVRFEQGLSYFYPYGLHVSGGGAMFVAPNAASLFRSFDGAPWSPTGLALPGDGYIMDISLRGGSDDHLAVATTAGLFLSSDGGTSFGAAAATGLPNTVDLLRIEDAGGGRIYAAYGMPIAPATAQVYRSDDNGATFAPTGNLPGFGGYLMPRAGDLESAPTDPDRVYYVSLDAIYRSDNGGATWTQCGAAGNDLGTLLVDGGDADTLWVTHGAGLASSADGCTTWTTHASGISADGMRTDLVRGIALAPGFPGNPRMWAGTDYGGVYRSDNAGTTFSPVNTGLLSTNIRAVAVHPAVPGQMFAGFGDAGSASGTLFRSTDDGQTWSRSNNGLRAVNIRGLTIDPTTAANPGGAHIYAVGTSRVFHEAPTPANTDGGIYRSTDGGTTWTTIDDGLPNTYFGTRYVGTVRNLALDPRSCASPPASGTCTTGPLRTAYATAGGIANHAAGVYTAPRIYKTTNADSAGITWTAAETGLPPPSLSGSCYTSQIAVPLVIDPTDTDTLYVGLSLGSALDGCPEPTVANGIFKSVDGGATWQHASAGLDRVGGVGSSHYNILALAIDPTDPDVLYAGGFRSISDFSDGRVFKSVDGGANWTSISVGIAGADVRALLVDPADPDTVYAGVGGGTLSDPSGVYRSIDGGLTWNSFSIGLPADSTTALSLDPHTPGRLLAGTVGGLWEFTAVSDPDSDGAASSVENAAPNAGDANNDGMPDAQQSHVASFQGTGSNGLTEGSLPQVTIDVTPIVGTCTRINNAHAISADQLPADIARGVAPAVFDRGVLRFELPDCERATVTVKFHGADASDVDWVWRNYGPTTPGDARSFAWYTFEGASKTAPDTWSLTIDATQRGNYRAASDAILFVGAPGFVDIHLFGDGME